MKIVPLFLKAPRADQGLGMSEQEIGLCYGTFGAAAFVLGSILAGYYIAHKGLQKSLFPLCCVFNIPFVAYTLLAFYHPDSLWLIGGGIVWAASGGLAGFLSAYSLDLGPMCAGAFLFSFPVMILSMYL